MASIQEYQEQEAQNYEEVIQNGEEVNQNNQPRFEAAQKEAQSAVTIEEIQEETVSAEEAVSLKRQQTVIIDEQRKTEKEKKVGYFVCVFLPISAYLNIIIFLLIFSISPRM